MLFEKTRCNGKAKSRRGSRLRRGAVTVEMAFALPVLILTTFSGIEFSRVNFIRNSIENAAYEGAREGIIPGATAEECRAAANTMINAIGIAGATVTVSPNPLTNSAETVTVNISVPLTLANGYVTPRFYLGKSIVTEIQLPRERQL